MASNYPKPDPTIFFPLVKKGGQELEKELIGENGSFAYIVSINGKVGRELSTPIPDGAEVFFFTPLGGG